MKINYTCTFVHKHVNSIRTISDQFVLLFGIMVLCLIKFIERHLRHWGMRHNSFVPLFEITVFCCFVRFIGNAQALKHIYPFNWNNDNFRRFIEKCSNIKIHVFFNNYLLLFKLCTNSYSNIMVFLHLWCFL